MWHGLLWRVCGVLLGVCGAALAAGAPAAAAQSGPPDKAAELDQLRGKIQSLQGELKSARREKDTLRGRLKKLDQRVRSATGRLHQLERDEARMTDRLAGLRRQQQALKGQLDTHYQALASHARASYMMGEQGYLKLLLRQEEGGAVDRDLMYYRYLNHARLEHIAQINSRLEELTALEATIERQARELDALQKTTRAQRQALEQDKQERVRVLAALESDIRDKGRTLKQLVADARRLEQLLARLKKQAEAAPRPPGGVGLSRLKGRLPWPTKGNMSAQFGDWRESGKLRWQGALIDAPEGTPVRAIAPGRVVFANVLRGYGQLLIVDHGDGFMSLYGHNDSLARGVGDKVAAGDQVARAGTSGGRAESGLYFEIRYNGKPLDPAAWCEGTP